MLLKIKDITVHYGKSLALNKVNLEVEEGEVVGIIGANGAGKSTVLKAISGLVRPTSGEIWFSDRKISGMAIDDIVKLGIVHVPEGRRLFPHLSAAINLKLGASLRKDEAGTKSDLDEIFRIFPILYERRNQQAGSLSGGEQQMLAIARGLMARPKLLLMDEPSVGLAPIIVNELGKVIKSINSKGVSIILVEQKVSLALRVAHRGYALQIGRVTLEGDIEKFKSSEAVRMAYMGSLD
jgi:branched-chain amino acid transport system ATP-binding protein